MIILPSAAFAKLLPSYRFNWMVRCSHTRTEKGVNRSGGAAQASNGTSTVCVAHGHAETLVLAMLVGREKV